jgi:glycosyltransferase involved in cell wall biosynthesis
MRILYLHPRSWSGEIFMLHALRDMGHEVCVLEEKRGLAPARWVDADHFDQPGDGIRTCWYDPGRGWEKLFTWPFDRFFKSGFEGRNLVHRMWMIEKAVNQLLPDVIVCSDGFTFALPASFLKQLDVVRVPLVVSYIGGDILDCPHAEVGRSRRGLTGQLIARSYRGIDVLRPVSPMLADVLLGDGVAAARMRVCPSHLVAPAPVLSAIRERRTALRSELRRRLGIAQEAPVIVTLSANILGKGVHVLAQAWPEVLRALPEARWLLCGAQSDWLRRQVLPMLEAARVSPSVVLTGQLGGEAVFEHLAAADLHINPSLCEGLNMVTVEAGAVGTPSITTSSAGIAAWVERYAAGAVVPGGEVAPLADAIIGTFHQPNRLRDWSAAAIAMSGEFTLERVAGELAEILQRAVDSERPK